MWASQQSLEEAYRAGASGTLQDGTPAGNGIITEAPAVLSCHAADFEFDGRGVVRTDEAPQGLQEPIRPEQRLQLVERILGSALGHTVNRRTGVFETGGLSVVALAHQIVQEVRRLRWDLQEARERRAEKQASG